MDLIDIQTLVCGAYGWFQQALIRLCVCAAVALFAVLVLRTQAVRDMAARIAALWREASHFTCLVVLTLLSVCVIDAGIIGPSGTVTVGEGATLDMCGKMNFGAFDFVLAGGTLASSALYAYCFHDNEGMQDMWESPA